MKLKTLQLRTLILGGLAGLCLCFVLVRFWSTRPTPYYDASANIVEALVDENYEQFKKTLDGNALSDHKLRDEELEIVFREFLVPTFRKGKIDLTRLTENRAKGAGTALFEVVVPPHNVKVTIGSTAEYRYGHVGNSLEDVFLNAFAILSAEKNDIKGPLQHLKARIVENRDRLETMGMMGMARTKFKPRYYTWGEYLDLLDRNIAAEIKSGNLKA